MSVFVLTLPHIIKITSNMNQTKLFFLLIAALAFASCGSDEPRYANPEAHEKAFFR